MARTLRYADALAEARREYEAWLARTERSSGQCSCGRRTRGGQRRCDVCIAAATPRACACGGDVWARGMCRPCYFKDYNRRNPGQRRRKPKVSGWPQWREKQGELGERRTVA